MQIQDIFRSNKIGGDDWLTKKRQSTVFGQKRRHCELALLSEQEGKEHLTWAGSVGQRTGAAVGHWQHKAVA